MAAAVATVATRLLPIVLPIAKDLLVEYGPKLLNFASQTLSKKINPETLPSLGEDDKNKLKKFMPENSGITIPMLYQILGKQKAVQLLPDVLKQVKPTNKTENAEQALILEYLDKYIKNSSTARGPDIEVASLLEQCFEDLVACPYFREKIDVQNQSAKKQKVSTNPYCENKFYNARQNTLYYSVMSSVMNSRFLDLSDPHVDLFFPDNNIQPEQNVDIVHFLYFLMQFVRAKTNHKNTGYSCAICKCKPESLADTMSKISIELFIQSRTLINMLNTYFGCGLFTANEFVRMLKPPCYPFNGTFPWDMNSYITEMFKRVNHYGDHDRVAYHGILYSTCSEEDLNNYASQMLQCLLRNNPYYRHAFLYATGTIQTPKHWCGIFFDIKINTCFFYNSLAKPSHENWKLVAAFNKLCDSWGLQKFLITKQISNKDVLQGQSSCCGQFVYDFFSEIVATKPNESVKMFQEYTRNDSGKTLDGSLLTKISNRMNILNDRHTWFPNI